MSARLLDAPYTTRILVRKPRDPGMFNGTVIVEPLAGMAIVAPA